MKYELPKLNYNYNGLEPYIDVQTVEIHYAKHHQNYLNNLNDVLAKYPKVNKKKLPDLLRDFEKLKMEEKDKTKFKNNAGGYLNHNLYWDNMGPKKEVDEILIEELKKEFGSMEEFKKKFTEVAMSHFGSGWAWLVKNEKNKPEIYSLPNQDSPYLKNHIPIIALDLWEHAYYLKYQNRRPEYIENWWKVFKLI